jgi:hypothetical protein
LSRFLIMDDWLIPVCSLWDTHARRTWSRLAIVTLQPYREDHSLARNLQQQIIIVRVAFRGSSESHGARSRLVVNEAASLAT